MVSRRRTGDFRTVSEEMFHYIYLLLSAGLTWPGCDVETKIDKTCDISPYKRTGTCILWKVYISFYNNFYEVECQQ